MSNGDLNWITDFIWGIEDSLPAATELEPIDDLIEVDEFDEAIDASENEEVAA